MLLLAFALAFLLIGCVAAQNFDLSAIDGIPTIDVNSALAIASGATVAANAIAGSATEDVVPGATLAAPAVANSATRNAGSVASVATKTSAAVASVATGTTATTSTTPASSSPATAAPTTPTATASTAEATDSSSTSISSSLPMSTAAASSSIATTSKSAAASSAPSSSSKVGVGVGVPLGVIMASALIVFLIYRHKRYKQSSRLGHHNNMGAGKAYHKGDEENKENAVGSWNQGTYETAPRESATHDSGWSDGGGVVGVLPEVHGEHIPPYSTELGGTTGVKRVELP